MSLHVIAVVQLQKCSQSIINQISLDPDKLRYF